MLAHQERGKNTLQKSNNKVLLGICDFCVGLPTVRIAHGIGMITGVGMSFALNMALAGEEQVQQSPGHTAFIDAFIQYGSLREVRKKHTYRDTNHHALFYSKSMFFIGKQPLFSNSISTGPFKSAEFHVNCVGF